MPMQQKQLIWLHVPQDLNTSASGYTVFTRMAHAWTHPIANWTIALNSWMFLSIKMRVHTRVLNTFRYFMYLLTLSILEFADCWMIRFYTRIWLDAHLSPSLVGHQIASRIAASNTCKQFSITPHASLALGRSPRRNAAWTAITVSGSLLYFPPRLFRICTGYRYKN